MSDFNPQLIGGMRVVVNRPIEVKIKRTWKERLLTFPWTPMVEFKTELHEVIKDGEVIIDKVNQVIYCNQKMYRKLSEMKL